ncbi:MAG: MFS transporter [Streptosporangiales bacterium]|nr:MFS transporter [Streptosporangiales bacterium]
MPLTSAHYKAGIALFVAFVIEAWEMLIIAFIAGPLSEDLGFGQVATGFLISALFLGMIPGALLWGPVCDRVGRKRTALVSIGAYGVLTLLAATSVSYEMLWALRFIAGLAMSGIFVITFPYFEELLPVRYRGRATVYLASGWPFGTLLAVGVALLLLPLGWRWVIVVSGLASLWALAIWRWVPESPYWLVNQGRTDEARDVLRRLSGGAVGDDVELTIEHGRGTAANLREMLVGGFGMLTLMQVLVNFTFAYGYWGLATWLPPLLQERGLSQTGSLAFIAITALFMIPGYITASSLTGRYGRKRVFLAYIIVAAIGGFLFAAANSVTMLYLASFVLWFFALGAWGVWDTWFGELYPTRLRANGYAWGVASQRVANAIAPTITGVFVASGAGFTGTVAFVEAFVVVAALLAFYFRETEGLELA